MADDIETLRDIISEWAYPIETGPALANKAYNDAITIAYKAYDDALALARKAYNDALTPSDKE